MPDDAGIIALTPSPILRSAKADKKMSMACQFLPPHSRVRKPRAAKRQPSGWPLRNKSLLRTHRFQLVRFDLGTADEIAHVGSDEYPGFP